MIIDHIGRKVKYFSEPSDFPYLHTLAPEAQKELIDSLAEDYEKFRRQKAFIAKLLAKQRNADKVAA